jgi:dienelactone hydrolase
LAAARAAWRRRRGRIREAVFQALDLPRHPAGPAAGKPAAGPTRADPPRAVLLGTARRGALVVERLFIEGRPGIWASALVYRKAGTTGPRPAVLHALGHYGPGKRYGPARIFDANLAHLGFVVLVVDCLSLGERRTGPENHHFQGMLHWLVGSSAARVLYGELPRFLDYLQARPDVDAGRIGMVGSSGGGTATLYTAALQERVRAAAVLAAVTRWEHLFRIIGGDPEQYPFDIVRHADFATLLRLVAPRPLLVAAGKRDDLFPPGPARRAVHRARDAYRLLGAPSHLEFARDGAPHGLQPPRRLATYRFFARHLLGRDPAAAGRIREQPGRALPARDPALRTGTPPDSRSLVDAARDRGRGLPSSMGRLHDAASARRRQRRRRASLKAVLQAGRHHPAAARSGRPARGRGGGPRAPRWRPDPGRRSPQWIAARRWRTHRSSPRPRIRRAGFFRAAGLRVPAVWIAPPGEPRVGVVYVTDTGRGGAVHAVALSEAGASVLVPDLAGLGELTPDRRYRYALMRRPGPLYMQDFFGLALLLVLGDSLCALRVVQIRQAVALLRRRVGVPVAVVGQGTESGFHALLAAALFPDSIAGAAALDPLRSLRDELRAARFPAPAVVAHGLLRVADTDTLAALIAPRPLLVIGGRTSPGRPLPPVPAIHFREAQRFYRRLGVPDRLQIRRAVRSRSRHVRAWLGRIAGGR